MKIAYKINGRSVTTEEYEAHCKKREELYGNQMEEMLSSGQSPRVMTDDVFLSGIGNLDEQLNPREIQLVTHNAMKHGYRPRPTDWYNSSLARFPGDPEAFLNHGQGRGHIKKVLESRGMKQLPGGEVIVTDKPEDDPYQNPRHALHPELEKRVTKRRLKENPELSEMKPEELHEKVVDEHGWKKGR